MPIVQQNRIIDHRNLHTGILFLEAAQKHQPGIVRCIRNAQEDNTGKSLKTNQGWGIQIVALMDSINLSAFDCFVMLEFSLIHHGPRVVLCLAKTKSAFEINPTQSGRVTRCMDEIHLLQSLVEEQG